MKKKVKLKNKKRDTETKDENKSLFCTECDETLDDFCFDDVSKNKNKVIKRHMKCVKSGKFKGEFCSRVFISSESLPDGLFEELE